MRIIKEQTVGLVIDIQERLFPSIHENTQFLNNTLRLIEGLKILEVPIIVTEQYKKGLGLTVPEVSNITVGFETLEKTAFSCCDDESFIKSLLDTRKRNVILCGIEAHICVMQNSIDLIEKGFTPVVIQDCTSSRKPIDKEIAIKRLRMEGAVITSSESVLFELCRYSGTEQFKAISRLVK
jgi:nicotinamidase-related amidase